MTHICQILRKAALTEKRRKEKKKEKAKIQTVFDFPGEVIDLRKHVHAKSTRYGVSNSRAPQLN